MMDLYRADGRLLNELSNASGFKAWQPTTLDQAREYLLDFVGAKSKKNLSSHIWGNDRKLISTAVDNNCAGQRGSKPGGHNPHNWRYYPVYKIVIPGFEKRELTKTVLGTEPRKFSAVKSPILYMNASTLSSATIFGLRVNKFGPEVSMFTTIPYLSGQQIITLDTDGEKND